MRFLGHTPALLQHDAVKFLSGPPFLLGHSPIPEGNHGSLDAGDPRLGARLPMVEYADRPAFNKCEERVPHVSSVMCCRNTASAASTMYRWVTIIGRAGECSS